MSPYETPLGTGCVIIAHTQLDHDTKKIKPQMGLYFIQLQKKSYNKILLTDGRPVGQTTGRKNTCIAYFVKLYLSSTITFVATF